MVRYQKNIVKIFFMYPDLIGGRGEESCNWKTILTFLSSISSICQKIREWRHFQTYEEASEWFDTHDMADYEKQLKPVDFHFDSVDAINS